MNIQIRVISANARKQIAGLEGELAGLRTQMTRSGAASAGVVRPEFFTNMRKAGSQMQWTGRQLSYNFTLPIVAAGVAATKFALDNERNMVKVVKVYGDVGMATSQVKSETDALRGSFEALSNFWGVQQSDVIAVAATWAQAGASGVALAKAVDLTLATIVLGDIEATKATQALIAIQAQYGQQVGDIRGLIDGSSKATKGQNAATATLAETISILNMVENQTGIDMGGLIDGMARAAGVARSTGVDVRHLAAFLAAMTPAAGSAAQAGNALKTILSRLFSPTKEAAQVLGMLGIKTDDVAWSSLNGAQRLELLAEKFMKLKGASDKTVSSQAAVVSSVIASRWQINRFDVLMRDIANTNGYYQKALHSTSSELANFRQVQKELNTVLSSNPQRLKQIWVILQNALADIIQPLIPAILMFMQTIASLARAFANLDPRIQKVVMYSLLFVAVLGPALKIIGTFRELIAVLGEAFWLLGPRILGAVRGIYALASAPFRLIITGLGAVVSGLGAMVSLFLGGFKAMFTGALAAGKGFFGALIGAFRGGFAALFTGIRAASAALVPLLLSPWGLVAVGVATILIIFRKQVVQAFHWIVEQISKAFWMLPDSVTGALIAVVKVIQQAALAAYDWLQYLNPFAHHSPSLVDSVQRGMRIIGEAFGQGTDIGKYFKTASYDLAKFKDEMNNLNLDEFSQQREDITKGFPSLLAGFNQLVIDLHNLKRVLDQVQASIDVQQNVVDSWKNKLDTVNSVLDLQSKKLRDLQDQANALTDAIQKHQSALDDFANAPIQGEQALGDAIFRNEMAQKRLTLEMMKMEDAIGPLDDLQSKIAAINGDIDKLRGEQATLREAGAGSDILGTYDAQVTALENQQKQINKTIGPLQDMQKALDALDRKGQELDLVQSLKFDPLHRAIQTLASDVQELSFKQIIDGINKERSTIDSLQPTLDKYNAQIAIQQALVDKLTKNRDALQSRYDRENDKLQKLQDAYGILQGKIQDVTSALNDMGSAAQSANQKADQLSPGAQNFVDAAGGKFPAVGGAGKIGREGGLGDQTDLINQYTQQISQALSDQFGKFNVFGPLKDKWNGFWSGVKSTVPGFVTDLGNSMSSAVSGLSNPFDNWGVLDMFKDIFNRVIDYVKTIVSTIKSVFELFAPDLKRIFSNLAQGISKAWDKVGPEIVKNLKLIPPVIQAISRVAGFVITVLKPIAAVLLAVLLPAFKVLISILGHTLMPVIDFIIGAITNLLKIFRGFIEVITGLINGDWSMAWQGMKDIFSGIMGEIINILWGIPKIILGIIEGLVGGILGYFKWLGTKIFSTLGKIIKSIINFFVDLAKKLVGASIIPDMILSIIEWFVLLPVKVLVALAELGIKLAKLAYDAMKSLFDSFVNAWPAISDWLKSLPGKAYDLMKSLITKLANLGWNAFKSFLEKEKEGWEIIGKWLGSLPSAAYDLVKGWITKLGSIGKDAFSSFWTKEKEGWKVIGDWLSNIPQSAYDRVKSIVSKLGSLGTDAFNSMKSHMSSAWNTTWNWLKDIPGKIVDLFKGIPGKLKHAFDGMFDGIKNAFKSSINWFVDKWNHFKIPGFDPPGPGPKIGSIHLPHIDPLARGGITNGPALVGEGRRSYPEFVIPTDPAYRQNAVSLLSSVTAQILGDRSSLRRMNTASAMLGGSSSAYRDTVRVKVILPSDTGKKEVNFYGDLSFPNITSPDDAEEFLRNLDSLVND